MTNWPEDRVTANKPFTFVGVDFFGPFVVKRGRSEAEKYGCIFTCMTIRAVHLEVTHSLDTDSFLNALRRFMARRGKPGQIRSDNGGNFVKGSKEISNGIRRLMYIFYNTRLSGYSIPLRDPIMEGHGKGVFELYGKSSMQSSISRPLMTKV